MVKREIISLHIGQAGIQVANSMWELYCLEHLIGPDGYLVDTLPDNDSSYETFFEITDKMRFVPRSIFFDTENVTIDEIVTGAYNQLYHPCQLIKGYEDAANNFARGSFTVSKAHLHTLLERIRKTVESCDYTEGFMVTHSLGGGTGSGFTSILAHTLKAEYAKFCRVQVAVFPGQTMSTAVVEPYNTLLHIHSTIECVDLSILFGNEALYELCSDLLFIESCTFTNINRIVALILSSATAPMRFKGQLNSDLGELQTNLVPYPRIHFPLIRYSPIFHYQKTKHIKPSVPVITRDVFSKRYQTLKTEACNGRYIAIVLNYRGAVSQRDINDTIQTMKLKHELDFVDWCPTGFKIGLNSTEQTVVPESAIAPSDYSVSMIANTTAIKDAWLRLGRKFHSLYKRKAFIHWYLDEGMEEFEFDEAYENVLMLVEDYNECCMTSPEIEMLDISKPEVKSVKSPTQRPSRPPRPEISSRLLLRRHSNRAVAEPPMMTAANRRLKQRILKGKPTNKMEKKIVTNKTADQMINTAKLKGSSSAAS